MFIIRTKTFLVLFCIKIDYAKYFTKYVFISQIKVSAQNLNLLAIREIKYLQIGKVGQGYKIQLQNQYKKDTPVSVFGGHWHFQQVEKLATQNSMGSEVFMEFHRADIQLRSIFWIKVRCSSQGNIKTFQGP